MSLARAKPRVRQKLPEWLRPFFWDYPFGRLDLQQDRELIIGRLLASGTLPALQWLRRQVGEDGLRDWLTRRRGGGLSPRQLRFWEIILELPHREVTAWLAAPERRVWDERFNS